MLHQRTSSVWRQIPTRRCGFRLAVFGAKGFDSLKGANTGLPLEPDADAIQTKEGLVDERSDGHRHLGDKVHRCTLQAKRMSTILFRINVKQLLHTPITYVQLSRDGSD